MLKEFFLSSNDKNKMKIKIKFEIESNGVQ